MLHRISLEIARGRPLWAIVMLNSYNNSAGTGALRRLASQRISRGQSRNMSPHILQELTQGKCLSELGDEYSDNIKTLERGIRLKETKKRERIRASQNASYIASLKIKAVRKSLTLPSSARREKVDRNRLKRGFFPGVNQQVKYDCASRINQ